MLCGGGRGVKEVVVGVIGGRNSGRGPGDDGWDSRRLREPRAAGALFQRAAGPGRFEAT